MVELLSDFLSVLLPQLANGLDPPGRCFNLLIC